MDYKSLFTVFGLALVAGACTTNKPESGTDTADTGTVEATVPEVVYSDSLVAISAGHTTANLAFIGKLDDAKAQEYDVTTAPTVFVNGLITDFDDAAHLWCWGEDGSVLIDRNPDIVLPELNLIGFEIPMNVLNRPFRCSLGGPSSLNTEDGWTYFEDVADMDPSLWNGYVCRNGDDGTYNLRFTLTSANAAKGGCP